MLDEIVTYLSTIIELKMIDSPHKDDKSLRNIRREISELQPRSHILTSEHSESKSGNYRTLSSRTTTLRRYTDNMDTYGSSQLEIPKYTNTSEDSRAESPRRKRGPQIQALSPVSEIGGVQIELNSISGNPTEGEELPAENF